MTEQQIRDTLALRYAVYKAGADKGFWQDIDNNSAKDVMTYLFPRTGNIAYYHLILETCKGKQQAYNNIFNLFKFPARIEEELLNFLKNNLNFDIQEYVGTPSEYIDKKATVTVQDSEEPVNIGRLSNFDDFNTFLAVLASVYRNTFRLGVNHFPYFD